MKLPTKASGGIVARPSTAMDIIDPAVKEECLKVLKEVDEELGDKPKAMADLEKVYDIIEKIYPQNATIPPKQSLDPTIRAQGIDIQYIEDDGTVQSGGLAYVYRAWNGSYRIFLTPMAIDNEKKHMDLHEKGHIVYNHLNVGPNREHFKRLIAKEFRKVKDYFSDTALRNKTEDELVDFLYWKFANKAQDMEINSKQFREDWEISKRTMSRVSAEAAIKSADTPKKQKVFVAGLIRELEGEGNPYFCHPENYPGLWHEMDWMFYMKFLIQNIENEVQKIATAAAGSSGPKSKETGAGKGGIGDEDVDDAKNDEKREEQPDIDDVEETDDEFDEGGHNAGNSHNVALMEPQQVGSMEDLAGIIQRHSYSHEKRFLRTDVLYNTNRNKHTGVVIPRRHYIRKVYPGAMQFLVDVSGSVNISLVEACIQTIKDTVQFDKKRSHVVCWDTRLCADFTLDGPVKIPRGGDNKCVLGVKYIAERYIKRPDDKLFWVSDYGDTLWEIAQEAKKLNCYRASIGYSYNGSDPFDSDWSHMDTKQRQEYMRIFDCFTVDGTKYR